MIEGKTNLQFSRINGPCALKMSRVKGREPLDCVIRGAASHCYVCFFGFLAIVIYHAQGVEKEKTYQMKGKNPSVRATVKVQSQ